MEVCVCMSERDHILLLKASQVIHKRLGKADLEQWMDCVSLKSSFKYNFFQPNLDFRGCEVTEVPWKISELESFPETFNYWLKYSYAE